MQSYQFGSSPYLQASDYQARADVTFANGYELSGNKMFMTLLSGAVRKLSPVKTNQFRITMAPSSYSNFNGG